MQKFRMQSTSNWWLQRSCAYFMFTFKENDISQIVRRSKIIIFKWIKTKDEKFSNFYWQSGYGAFSVNPTEIDVVKKYIQNQEEHHKVKNFQDEYRAFLKKYKVEYDEKYVWD